MKWISEVLWRWQFTNRAQTRSGFQSVQNLQQLLRSVGDFGLTGHQEFRCFRHTLSASVQVRAVVLFQALTLGSVPEYVLTTPLCAHRLGVGGCPHWSSVLRKDIFTAPCASSHLIDCSEKAMGDKVMFSGKTMISYIHTCGKCPLFNVTPNSPAQEVCLAEVVDLFHYNWAFSVTLCQTHLPWSIQYIFSCRVLLKTTLPFSMDCYGNQRNREDDVSIYIHEEEYLVIVWARFSPTKMFALPLRHESRGQTAENPCE